MTARIVIDDLRPRTPDGEHPAKAVVGEAVHVSADVFRDGHAVLAGRVRWRPEGDAKWSVAPLRPLGNDRWEAVFEPAALGMHVFEVEAWTDRFATWARDTSLKQQAGQDVSLECEEGARIVAELAGLLGTRASRRERTLLAAAVAALRDQAAPFAERLAAALDPAVVAVLAGVPEPGDLTASPPRPLWVDRERALAGAWYELFPRSEGGLRATADRRLPEVAAMGFDVLYLPPIHPIGRSHRKGRNNTLEPAPDDPGSPWAIGSAEGGHTAVHAELGTLADFDHLVVRAEEMGMEVALDYALQCSPDHPWVAVHPEWFHHRPDGSIQYAENPPKKYQDIYPINFWPEPDSARVELWEACRQILDFWIGHGVCIFRVDNPHTKPIAFWEWLIPAVQRSHPETLFLAEAFTRPKIMSKLAEVGFTQSYTYFTWRTAKQELADYLAEVALGPKADYMRPNFWPNTPDILSGPLRDGPPAAFALRLVLAATMVPSYGIYSGYELCENVPASEANEEYLWSEKYEVKHRDWSRPDSLAPLLTRLNDVRRRHPALSALRNVTLVPSWNDQILAWVKRTDDRSDVVLVVANLDPRRPNEDTLTLDLVDLALPLDAPFEAHDELTGTTYTWTGAHPYVRLDPVLQPAHVFSLRRAGPPGVSTR